MLSDAGGSAFDFAKEVKAGPFNRSQAAMVLVLGSLVLLDGMDTQMLAVIARDITDHLGLPIASFGIVFSSGLLGAVIGALAISPMGDRWLGRKAITILAMSIAALSTVATPLAGNLGELLVIRMVAGVGLGAHGRS